MLQFSKMHGLGNDFMVVNGISQRFDVASVDLAGLANRKTGIGFDQLLLVEPPTQKNTAFKYRIFNADGSEVSQCGNGARCFAKFVKDQGLTELDDFWVETNTGRIRLSVLADEQVRVNMGVPRFEPEFVPLAVETEQARYAVVFEDKRWQFSALEIGNPHAVFEVNSIAQAPVNTLGQFLQSHELFPERVNAGFFERVSEAEINLRVFERGVGETRACGSGACAAVVAGHRLGLLSGRVQVNLSGGSLQIDYAGEGEPVFLCGPATTVYHGNLEAKL
ncbi:MAG: diaminopimelate epimerase [Proteobacteria bacterium]|nr:diaminopimelate epimerase [Pseudomonadota bacterium]